MVVTKRVEPQRKRRRVAGWRNASVGADAAVRLVAAFVALLAGGKTEGKSPPASWWGVWYTGDEEDEMSPQTEHHSLTADKETPRRERKQKP